MYDQRRDYFDYHAPSWDAMGVPEKQDRLRRIFSEFQSAIVSPLLDLGCGTGILIPIVTDILPTPSKIVEFDLAYGMLQQVNAKSKNDQRINLINGDVHFLPFADQTIGTAVCFESLPHFRNLPAALQELQRVLQPSGTLIILHLMGREKLNKFHGQAGEAVCRDHLPPLAELSGMLGRLQFEPLQQADADDLFLIVARKC